MPRGSSRGPPCTGRREWPAVRKTASTSASVVCSATATMSARGTITSPTCTSCKARTFFNKARSCGEISSSIDGSARASSMSSRIDSPPRPNKARNRSNRLGFPPEPVLPASLVGSCSVIGAGCFLDQRFPEGVGNPEPAENRAFERLHRLGFGRPDMVVPNQMQKAMHQKMGDVIAQRPSCFGGFLRGGLERDDDVAEERRRSRTTPGWKRKNIGRLIDSPPFAVEVADEAVVAEKDADFGVRCQRDAGFPDRREDRGLGKLRRGLEGHPIFSFDRNFDHGIHVRRPSPLAGRAYAS